MTKTRLFIYLFILASSLSFYWYYTNYWRPQMLLAQQVKPLGPVVSTPQALMEKLQRTYRLQPDKRFLGAVEDIHHFFSKTNCLASAQLNESNSWDIRCNEQFVGTLEDLPSAEKALALLESWARSLVDESLFIQLSPAQIVVLEELANSDPGYDSVLLHRSLRIVDGLWNEGGRSPAVIEQAADYLSRLSFAGFDSLETGDQLYSQALAIMSIAKVVSDQIAPEIEARLSYAMGYHSHAKRLVSRLGAASPLRLYLSKKDQRLQMLPASSNLSRSQDYLVLLRAAERGDSAAWLDILKEVEGRDGEIGVYRLVTSRFLSGFQPEIPAFKLIPRRVLSELLQDVKPEVLKAVLTEIEGHSLADQSMEHMLENILTRLESDPAYLTEHFEIYLKHVGEGYAGPFLDQNTYRATHRAFFFSGLHKLATHYIDNYSDIEAAEEFAQQIGEPVSGVAGDFHLWYSALLDSMHGRESSQQLKGNLEGLHTFGAPPLIRTLKEQFQGLHFMSQEKGPVLAKVVGRADSRINHRYSVAFILRDHLYFLSRAEKLFESILRDDPEYADRLLVWTARYNGRWNELFEIIKSRTDDPKLQAYALGRLDANKVKKEQLIDVFEMHLATEPARWEAYKKYEYHLQQWKNFARMEKLARDWLASNSEADSTEFDHLRALITLAKSLVGQGDIDAAWEVIDPTVESYYGPAMQQAIKVRLAQEDYQAAADIGVMLLNRYPHGVQSAVALVDILWAAQDFETAAELLRRWPKPIGLFDWKHKLGKAFAMRLKDNPAQAEDAFTKLIEAGIPQINLFQIGWAVHKAGDPELAFRLHTLVPWHAKDKEYFSVLAYRYIKEARGEEAGREWLKSQLDRRRRNFTAHALYDQHKFNLMWDFMGKPANDVTRSGVWLIRAATQAWGDKLSDKERKSLEKYYSDSDNDERTDRLGRFMLGMVSKQEILERPMSARELSEATYYLGLAAMRDKNPYAAADWFRASAETGERWSAEYQWSISRLKLWRKQDYSLTYQAQNDMLLNRGSAN